MDDDKNKESENLDETDPEDQPYEEVEIEPERNLPAEITGALPQMNVSLPAEGETKPCIVSDEMILDVYREVLDDIRDDRKEIDGLLANFVDMVMNDGDSTSASKEALVKLVELKIGAADKKAKIADLMTRIKLKDPDTYKPYLNANQTNNVTINTRRDLISKLKKGQKKLKGEG